MHVTTPQIGYEYNTLSDFGRHRIVSIKHGEKVTGNRTSYKLTVVVVFRSLGAAGKDWTARLRAIDKTFSAVLSGISSALFC